MFHQAIHLSEKKRAIKDARISAGKVFTIGAKAGLIGHCKVISLNLSESGRFHSNFF
jgi:hypothetical protein